MCILNTFAHFLKGREKMDSNEVRQSEQECHDVTTKDIICDYIIKYREKFIEFLKGMENVYDAVKSVVRWIRYM